MTDFALSPIIEIRAAFRVSILIQGSDFHPAEQGLVGRPRYVVTALQHMFELLSVYRPRQTSIRAGTSITLQRTAVRNTELQTAVKKRVVMRSSFTKIFNSTSQLLHTGSGGEIDLITIQANQAIVHGKISELSTLEECVSDLMLLAGVKKDELEGELSGSDV
ncbi:hypothetical protein PR048_007354 [Dryococelus australis]|uniref:Uncharacterized protein n=1 Tax=Dryococelus australis TaxID=614101 RepID=A0ABQ9IDE2_9NEOP|nr:hypothetical protein PR048_007354 [Dryococelus australis]